MAVYDVAFVWAFLSFFRCKNDQNWVKRKFREIIPLNISSNLTDKFLYRAYEILLIFNRPSLEFNLRCSGFKFQNSQKDKNLKIKCTSMRPWLENNSMIICWMVYPQGCPYQKSLLLTKFFWLNLGCWKQHVTVKRFRFKTFKFSPVLKQSEVRVQILHDSQYFKDVIVISNSDQFLVFI